MDKRVLILDLETSNLDADLGTLLCVGWKWLGEREVHVLSLADLPNYATDPTDDRDLTKALSAVYSSADLAVAYNGILLDRPLLIAKILEHNLPIPPNIPVQDPYFTAKSNMRISRKSLANVGYHLKIKTKKTPVEGRIWRKASAGHGPSLQYIVKHCYADIKMLEETYLRLRPLMRDHFRLSNNLGECKLCGAARLQSRGTAITKLRGVVKRVWCKACGGWDTRTQREIDQWKINPQ